MIHQIQRQKIGIPLSLKNVGEGMYGVLKITHLDKVFEIQEPVNQPS